MRGGWRWCSVLERQGESERNLLSASSTWFCIGLEIYECLPINVHIVHTSKDCWTLGNIWQIWTVTRLAAHGLSPTTTLIKTA
jgi:hypothetical protein